MDDCPWYHEESIKVIILIKRNPHPAAHANGEAITELKQTVNYLELILDLIMKHGNIG